MWLRYGIIKARPVYVVNVCGQFYTIQAYASAVSVGKGMEMDNIYWQIK